MSAETSHGVPGPIINIFDRFRPEPSIKSKIRNTKGVVSTNPAKRMVFELATAPLMPRIYVEDEEYELDNAEQILISGKKLIIMSNHLGHPDHLAVMRGIRGQDYTELADRTVFFVGLLFKEKKLLNFFTDAYNHVVVWPKAKPIITPEDEDDERRINRAGLRAGLNALNEGAALYVYPEGTRSRDSMLHVMDNETANLLYLARDAHVIFLGITGTEKIWHPSSKSVKDIRPGSVHIKVGRLQKLPPFMNKSDEEKTEIMKWATIETAKLLPENYLSPEVKALMPR